ncbi:20S-pre-rRNA D-site endonuclease nob1 [Malassezia brasiliensis]|uniref:20S-pre-rRNA D-site endonuclease NOB1 n=1 Tax=Malassezia brasiliensis TaxID=1821822 RepID=A0AAF0DVX8_9BASI|nr:20S-pre-rRNA D-site endonuclease nob1 [Malassezia brasiliensis]
MADAPRAPRIQKLVLDAAPLLTQAKIAGLAEKYFIPPTVLAELRDVRAREYLEHLHTTGQIDLEVREPGAEAMRKMIDFAKQTGDYAVLSAPDMHVLALTYALEVQTHGNWRIRDTVGGKVRPTQLTQTGQQQHEARKLEEKHSPAAAPQGPQASAPAPAPKARDTPAPSPPPRAATPEDGADDDGFVTVDAQHGFQPNAQPPLPRAPTRVADDEQEEDDEEVGGEWITPSNITQHKNKALGLVVEESETIPEKPSGRRRRGKKKGSSGGPLSVACMTGDFAVQNVLLQMGLRLVSVDGARIERVKSWVLRCHACYKICKDPERKFCPSCGNATLIRTSVSTGAPGKSGEQGLQVHLKPNFEYHNRGTIYSLPMPRAGSASGGRPSGSSRNAKTGVPILREDQPEWQRGVAKDKLRKQKEERALQRALDQGQDSLSARYADPDWLPDLLTGKHTATGPDLPALGIGRKNPNERRRRRK